MRRRYSSAEAAASRYAHLRGSLESARSANPITRVERCARCGGGPSTLEGKRGRQVARCSSCRELWDGALLEGPRAPSTGFDVSAWQEQVLELARLRPVFEPRPPRMELLDWRAHQIAYFAWIDPRLGSIPCVIDAGRALLPKAPRGWTERATRTTVDRAERIFETRLQRRRLWSGEPHSGGGSAWRRPRATRSG